MSPTSFSEVYGIKIDIKNAFHTIRVAFIDRAKLGVTFEEQDGKTTISLTHTDLPTHQAAVAMGWEDYYFTPIKEYFEA